MSCKYELPEPENGYHVENTNDNSTSLKALLALDLSCGKVARLEHDLDKVANTLNLPNDWRLKPCLTKTLLPESCKARAEWCLRWLLKALCNADLSFTHVRANVSSWILLGRIISQLPVSLTAKALNTNGFVKSLQYALRENYSHVTVNTLGSRLKYSKRNGTEEAHPSQSDNDQLEVSGQNLFHAIDEVLRLILKLALTQSSRSLANEHVKLSLTCDLYTAANIARLYIMGLNSYLLTYSEKCTQKIGDDLIAPASKLWEINLEDAENLADEGYMAFASQCTLPLVYTLAILEDLQRDTIDKYDIGFSCKTRSVIEYLIIKYSISCVPAHLSRSRKERQRRQSQILGPIIKEVKCEMTRLLVAKDEEKVDSGASLSLMASTVPLLFKLIVTSNFPDRRLCSEDEATPWESTFRTLADCFRADLSHNVHRNIPNVCAINMISLIEITIDQNIELGTDTLVFVTQLFSGICKPQPDNVDWGLIAVLFRVRNDTFLRSLLERSDQDQDNYQVRTVLLGNLLHHLARKSSETLMLQPSPEFHEGSLKAYEELKGLILYPLSTSLVRTRNIKLLISTWRSELNEAITIHRVSSELSIFSIWDDPEFATFITQLLQKYLSMQEISSLSCNEIKILKKHVKLEQHGILSAKAGSLPVYLELYASMTILSSLLSSLLYEGSINELITDLSALVSSLLYLLDELPNMYEMLKCNILRVLSQMYRLLWRDFDRSDGAVGERELNRLPWEFGLCLFERSFSNDNEVNSAELQLQHVTVYFLVSNWFEFSVRDMHTYVPSGFAGRFVGYMIDILHMLCMQDSLPSAAKLRWNGNSRRIHSLWHLSLANVSIAVHYPQIFNCCDRESRKLFFNDLCILAARIDLENAGLGLSDGVSYMELLTGLSDWVGTCSIIEIRGDFVLTMTKLIKSTTGTITKLTERASIVAEDQILRINTLIVRRDHRETILDAILHVTENQNIKFYERRLSVALHLMEAPNATAALCVDSEILWTIAKRLDTFNLLHVANALQLLDALTQKALTHILKTRDQSRSKTFLRDFLRVLQEILTKRKSYLSTIGTLSTIKISIQALRSHKLVLAEFEQIYVRTLLNDLAELLQRQSSEVCLLKYTETILIALLSSPFSHAYRAQIKLVSEKVIDNFSTSSSFLKVMCSAHLHQDDLELIYASMVTILEKDHSRERIHENYLILNFIIKSIALLQNGNLSITRQLFGETEDGNLSAQLFILREILAKRNTFSPISMADQELSSFLNWLCDKLPETLEPEIRLLQLDCINAIALNEGQSVSQWGLENILSAITRTALASGISYRQEYTNHNFSRFCSIIRTLLLSHRSKLRGRHHLLIECLQALLAGFFLPYKSKKSLPHSYSGMVVLTETTALDKHSAEDFCRVLTMWCSPPLSSLTRHKGTAELQLTDQGPKIKKYVSKFAVNFLEHYCNFQLSGRIRPEMRDLILPGLFALLDVMEKESMKTLNARLGASTQALWKKLYDEWKKSL